MALEALKGIKTVQQIAKEFDVHHGAGQRFGSHGNDMTAVLAAPVVRLHLAIH